MSRGEVAVRICDEIRDPEVYPYNAPTCSELYCNKGSAIRLSRIYYAWFFFLLEARELFSRAGYFDDNTLDGEAWRQFPLEGGSHQAHFGKSDSSMILVNIEPGLVVI